mmetsp:Transcript_24638/g.36923  ORF Transcript_24638/g.36923 Transcript_24638/m.36923 type:complete len:510 (-) Transcript_24638:581-2110(-)
MGASDISTSLSWLSEYKSLKVRQSVLERECGHYKLRFQNIDTSSPCSKRRKRSVLARDTGTSFEEEQSLLDEKLNVLREYSEAALLVLQKVENTAHDQLAKVVSVKQKCSKAVYLYEENLVQTNDHFRTKLILLEQERFTLENALNAFHTKCKSWGESSVSITKEERKKPAITDNRGHGGTNQIQVSESENSAVSLIDDAIERDGGKTGSWQVDEHNAFLKVWVRNKCRSKRIFITACREQTTSALHHRSDEEIESHYTWYESYRERCDKKRKLALKWRKRRDCMLAAEAADGSAKHDIPISNNKAKDSAIEEQIRIRRERKHAKIRAWRERKMAEDEEARASLEEKKARELFTRKKNAKRQEQMKELISEYKFKKLLEEEKDEIDRQPTFSKRFTHEEMERRRQKEIRLAQEKNIKIEKKARQKYARQEELRRLAPTAEVNAKRDPRRLLQSTRSRKTQEYTALELEKSSRKLALQGAHRKPVALGARDLNVISGIRRATPTWRQGIQ